MRNLEHLVRRGANSLGIDLHRYRPERSPFRQLANMLEFHEVDLVLDVGANTGQFAMSLRRAGFPGRIVSFEPLSGAYAELLRNSRPDPGWEVASRAAVGDRNGEVQIHVAGNSVSSSLLRMLDMHRNAAPESTFTGEECVPMVRLDTAAVPYLQNESVPFLKVDTQGFENAVLDGAGTLLSRCVGLHLELSFLPLYEGQELFHPLLDRLRSTGLEIWAIWPGIHDPESGRMLQVDAVLFRENTK